MILEVGVDVKEEHVDNIMDASLVSMVFNGLIWKVHFKRLIFRCSFLKVNDNSKTS